TSTGLQLLNAIPGVGIPLTVHQLTPWQRTPHPFAGTGWLWGLALGVGLLLLLRRRPAPEADDLAADRHPLLTLAGALAVSALAAALLLSLSVQSHEIVSWPGETYRATPWIWSCLAGIVVVLLLVPRRRARARQTAIILVPVIGALIAGVVVWPYDVAAIQTQRQSEGIMLWEKAQMELITGSGDPTAIAHRCALQQQAVTWAGTNGYRQQYLPIYRTAFSHQWGRAWCPDAP
ncbi:MAG TPA: hypothetical protein VLR88_02790, partial [Propionibacteriaceae bacterium]|nr:hypothetical protein [Propionibacteriaceae bacterium]